MAIKEFIIGPQNYFEEGYFDGDYTQPNVSKSFLECDVDNIKGGRVITGEYFQDNYIDGTYWHDNSIKITMTVDAMIVQEATVGLQSYYSEGYFQTGYYEERGSQFSLTADLEKVGMDVFATGEWSSSASMDITVGKIVQANSELVVEFTQETYGARDRDIDFFAFGEAAIAVTITVTRDNNIQLSSVFDIATDGRRFRDVTAQEESLFDFDIVNERSRDFNIETQAAFSFDVSYENYRPFASDLASEFAVSSVISNTRGVDITAFNEASLAVDPVVIRDAASTITSVSSITARVGFRQSASAQFKPYFGLRTNKWVGSGRPRNFTGNPNSLYNTTTKKFGSASLLGSIGAAATYSSTRPSVNEDWVVEFYQQYSANCGVHFGWIQFQILVSGTSTIFINDASGTPTTSISFSTQSTGMKHILVVKNSSGVSVYNNGTRVYNTTTLPTSYYAPNVFTVDPSQSGGSGLIDELSIHVGTTLGYNPSSTTITVPTQARTNNFPTTRGLWHFDSTLIDDMSGQVETAAAALKSAAAVSATLSGPVRLEAALSSAFSATVVAQKATEIILSGFSEANLAADADKLRDFSSDLTVDSNSNIDGNRIASNSSDLVAEYAATILNERLRAVSITTDSVASELAVVAKIADFFINCDVVASQTTDAVKTTDVTSEQTAQFDLVAIGYNLVDFSSAIDAAFASSASGSKTTGYISNQSSQFTQTVTAMNLQGFDVAISSAFIVDATPSGTIDFAVLTASLGTLAAEATITRTTSVSLASEFTQTTATFDSLAKRASANIAAQFAQTATGNSLLDAVIETESIATEFAIIGSIGQFFINCESASTLAVDAVKTTSGVVAADSASSLSIVPSKLLSTAIVEISTAATLTANASATVVGASIDAGTFTLEATATKNTGVICNTSSTVTVACFANRIRGGISLEASAGTMTVAGNATRSAVIHTESIASELVLGGVRIGVIANLNTAFAVTANIRVIHTNENVYTIPAENRAYTITGETRIKTIVGESRIYKIRR